jgi:hypothetical protein
MYTYLVCLGTFNVRTTLFKDGFQFKSAGKLSYWINNNLKNNHENENEKNEIEKINEKINLKKNLKKMFFFKNEKSAFIPTTSSNNIDINNFDTNNGLSGEVKVNVNALHPKNQKLPILFFHGIGGVFSYLKLINGFTLYGIFTCIYLCICK